MKTAMDIEITNWNTSHEIIKAIRTQVFIREQDVPEELEWDDDDQTAVHFIVKDGKRPIGYARLLAEGRLGRMAVLKPYRKHRVGTFLLRHIERYVQQEQHGATLKANTQSQAFQFYHKAGFTPYAAFNLDAGISHLPMQKVIGATDKISEYLMLGRDGLNYNFAHGSGAFSGLVQIACSQPQRELLFTITSLNKIDWFDKETASAMVSYLKQAKQNRIRILLQNEYAGMADHKLMQLQQRVSSRIEVKVHSEVSADRAISAPFGWVESGKDNIKACFNDRPRVARLTEQFEDLWRTGQNCKEIRRLKI